MKGFCQWLINN